MEILYRVYHNLKRQFSALPATVSNTVEKVNKSIIHARVPPFTKENVLFYYLPMQGLVSYTTLSIGVMNPHLMVRYVKLILSKSISLLI